MLGSCSRASWTNALGLSALIERLARAAGGLCTPSPPPCTGFETEVLADERNYQGLARLNTVLIQHALTGSPASRVTLDIDSSESPVHGTQEQSAYNGPFESVCYHPFFVFHEDGDCLAATLRPANVHSAGGWIAFCLSGR
jgi:Transposase DDE domain group 1